MKRTLLFVALWLMMAQIHATAQVSAVPALMNFQGRLAKPDGTPVTDGSYSLRFSLWSALTGGTEKWNQTINPVNVRNGVFAVVLSGFPVGTFNSNLWLEVKIGANPPLSPRQQMVTVAYAFKADSIKDGGVTTSSIANGAVTSVKIANGAVGAAQLANNAVTTEKIADGTILGNDIANATITADKFVAGIFNPIAWLLHGNSGVTDGFLGTTDNNPLELRVNKQRVMRYDYREDLSVAGQEFGGINVVGGSVLNKIANGVVGATIAGGGRDYFTLSDEPNSVFDHFGTIGGGEGNTAGYHAFVGGGVNNSAFGPESTVSGGANNVASNQVASVLGGVNNTASGYASMVAGGDTSTAMGDYSFAAGRLAQARHNGTFVWADSTNLDFFSTGPDQFLVRASGGASINTTPAPGVALTVNGLVQLNGFKLPTGATANKVLTSDVAGVGTWQDFTALLGMVQGDLQGTWPNLTIRDNAITTPKIKDGAVTTTKLVDGAVSTPKLGDGVVTTAKIANNAVTDAKINDVNWSKITNAPNFLKNGDAAGGDLTGTYPAPTIQQNVVNSGKLALDAASLAKVSNNTMFSAGSNIGIGIGSPLTPLDIRAGGLVAGFRSPIPSIVNGTNNGAALYMGADPGSVANAATGAIETSWGDSLFPQMGIGVVRDGARANILMDYAGNTTIRNGSNPLLGIAGNALVTVYPQDGISEGGEIVLQGVGSYPTWHMDSFDTAYRIFDQRGTFFVIRDRGDNGSVGIGRNYNPSASFSLDVGGDIRCVHLTQTSDVRFKKNITPFANALETVLNLQGVTFDWKREERKEIRFPANRQIGFIAQEVEKVLPELVDTDENGYKSVSYTSVIPVLVEALKVVNAKAETRQKQVDDLQKRVEKLEALLTTVLANKSENLPSKP